MPGNPLVRFDEGRVGRTARCSPSLLLYRLSPRLCVSALKSIACLVPAAPGQKHILIEG
jgi:hypothetical protein